MTTENPQNDTPADAADTAAVTAMGAAAAADATEDKANIDATNPDAVTATNPDGKPAEDAGGKPADPEGKADVETIIGAPEDYDATAFTMPEGVEFDGEMFDLVKDDLKGMDLSQKGAEKIVGLFAEKVAPAIAARTTKALDDHAAELRANMARDLQADPEVGGAKLKESQAYAAKAIAQFIPDAATRSEFSKFLNESGLGDHPLLTRVIAGAGRALSEASTPAAESASAPLTEAQKFYG